MRLRKGDIVRFRGDANGDRYEIVDIAYSVTDDSAWLIVENTRGEYRPRPFRTESHKVYRVDQ